jgi:serralysin
MPQPASSVLSNESNITYQARYERSDASENTSTAYTIYAGDTFEGTLSSTTDEDYIRVYLEAGTEYEFVMGGSDLGTGTLSDPYLRLRDSNDNVVAYNDDLGGGYLSSYFTYAPSSSGYYFIEADAYATYTGTYTIGFDVIEPAYEATLDELADYLTTGYWEDNFETPAAFDTRSNNVITVSLAGLDAIGVRFAEAAMEAWELVADLDFRIVTGSADITFTDNGTLEAYSTSDVSGGYITSAIVNVSADWVRTPYVDVTGDYDDYGLQTYIHELGHALGLGHQGAYNGNAIYGTDNLFANDSWMTSVMSYFSQTDNTNVDGTYAYVMTAMSADIVAIQDLYGAAAEGSATWGNTVWGHNSNLDTYLDELFDVATGGTSSHVGDNVMTFTVYDAGGTDLINLSTLNVDIDFDLRPMQSSSVGTLTNVIHIARGTVIENLTSGSGDDRLVGNGASNVIRSGDGDDTVFGNNGSDRIITGNGNDRVIGGNGYDVILTGAGRDIVNAGNGNDTISLGLGNDRVVDGAGRDTIYGGAGRDFINLGSGNDLVSGGTGNDVFVFGRRDGIDRITDFIEGGDRLRLDDALWSGTMDARDILDIYGTVNGQGNTVLLFDNGERLILNGVTDWGTFENDIIIF